MRTKSYEQYTRKNGVTLWVRKTLKGKHRDHCLCWDCAKFMPQPTNLNGKPVETIDGHVVWKIEDTNKELTPEELAEWEALLEGAKNSCPIAKALYEFDLANNITTPVWECGIFEIKNKKVEKVKKEKGEG